MEVISALAENAGARLSEKAYIDLIEKSETDETLLEKLGYALTFRSTFSGAYLSA